MAHLGSGSADVLDGFSHPPEQITCRIAANSLEMARKAGLGSVRRDRDIPLLRSHHRSRRPRPRRGGRSSARPVVAAATGRLDESGRHHQRRASRGSRGETCEREAFLVLWPRSVLLVRDRQRFASEYPAHQRSQVPHAPGFPHRRVRRDPAVGRKATSQGPKGGAVGRRPPGSSPRRWWHPGVSSIRAGNRPRSRCSGRSSRWRSR